MGVGQQSMMDLLIEKGANVNVVNKNGNSVLILALNKGKH